ncbi:MAG: hypothetical protein WBB25_22470 [Sulfitobacter sp.]
MTPPDDVPALLNAIPEGSSTGRAGGKSYVATRSVFNGGRSSKLVAEERGGPDYISLNFYDLARGPQLFPCEMPAAKVVDFLRNFRCDPSKPCDVPHLCVDLFLGADDCRLFPCKTLV